MRMILAAATMLLAGVAVGATATAPTTTAPATEPATRPVATAPAPAWVGRLISALPLRKEVPADPTDSDAVREAKRNEYERAYTADCAKVLAGSKGQIVTITTTYDELYEWRESYDNKVTLQRAVFRYSGTHAGTPYKITINVPITYRDYKDSRGTLPDAAALKMMETQAAEAKKSLTLGEQYTISGKIRTVSAWRKPDSVGVTMELMYPASLVPIKKPSPTTRAVSQGR